MSNNYADLKVNYNSAMEAITEINEKIQLLQDSNSELEVNYKLIREYWKSNSNDFFSTCIEVAKQIENLKTLGRLLGSLKNSVIRYLEEVKAASSSSIQ